MGAPAGPDVTWHEWVDWCARAHGHILSRDQIDWILWEHTPFPMSDGDSIKDAVLAYFGGPNGGAMTKLLYTLSDGRTLTEVTDRAYESVVGATRVELDDGHAVLITVTERRSVIVLPEQIVSVEIIDDTPQRLLPGEKTA